MCIAGVCKGYLLRRVPGSAVAGYQGLVIQEVDYGPDGWSAIFWSARRNDNLDTVQAWSLARVTDPSSAFVYSGTTTTENSYTALSNGLALRGFERVLAFGNNAWSTNNGLDRAVADEQLDFVSTLFSRMDVTTSGVAGMRRTWVGGSDSGDGVVLACHVTQQGVQCDPQALDTPEPGPYPVALAGVPLCSSNGSCTGQWMGAATRLIDQQPDGDVYFNDTYVNPTGAADVWPEGLIASDDSPNLIWSMAAWGTGTAPRMLAVGSGGYMLYMRESNDWSAPILVRVGQEDRTFTGVTVSADTVLVSATRFTTTEAVYELWTVPTTRDAAVGANWTAHELGRGPDVDATGLYDVSGRPNGEVMAVGGIRRATITGQVQWLDGLVYWRQAP